MIAYLPQSSETCLGFEVSGKLTTGDYEAFLPKLDKAIAAHGKINLLMVIDKFEGYAGADVAKTDFKFGTHQYHEVEKCALVGSKNWQKWLLKVIDPFTRRTDERYFDLDQLDEAWQWVQAVD